MTHTTEATMIYYVIYRTGGSERFEWRRTLAMTRAEAEQGQRELTAMGYRAHVERADHSDAIGLPETFEAGK